MFDLVTGVQYNELTDQTTLRLNQPRRFRTVLHYPLLRRPYLGAVGHTLDRNAVCDNLDAIATSLTRYAGTFEPAALDAAQAARAVALCAKIEASAAAIKALAATRHAQSGTWRQEGFRSAAEQLARRTGTSCATAQRTIDTGRRMTAQPQIARAALEGTLSPEQTAAVASGVEANPSKTAELLDAAGTYSLSELHERVVSIKAAVGDPEEHLKRLTARRGFRRWVDHEGALQAHLQGLPQHGAQLWQILDPIRRRLMMVRQSTTTAEPLQALDYDALMLIAAIASGDSGELDLHDLVQLGLFPQLRTTGKVDSQDLVSDFYPAQPPSSNSEFAGCEGPITDTPATPTDNGSRRSKRKLAGRAARIIIRVDLDTLLRGAPRDGETCEIAGYGPIAVSAIKSLAANQNTFIASVLTHHKQIIGVYHYRRQPSSHQKTALDFLYPTCAVKGCSVAAGLQTDHREDWARTHYTLFDLLDRLCYHHHRLKTTQNWALVNGTGKRDFVPPADPRHPRHAHPSPGPPGSQVARL